VLPKTAITASVDVIALPLLPDLRRQLIIVARDDLASTPGARHLVSALQTVADDITRPATHEG
jgi:hypothetical protein